VQQQIKKNTCPLWQQVSVQVRWKWWQHLASIGTKAAAVAASPANGEHLSG